MRFSNLPRRSRSAGRRLISKLPRRGFEERRRLTAEGWSEEYQHLAEDLPAKDPQQLRLLTLNIAHGRVQLPHQALLEPAEMRQNLHRIAAVMRHVEPDLVALQEADGPSSWSGNFDHVTTLTEFAEFESSYRGDHNPFGVGRFALASGTALMARFPLRDASSHRFAEVWRDTKGFVVAGVRIPEWNDLEIDVVSVHLDFLKPSIRRRQIGYMIEMLEARQRPLVVLGDLNCNWRTEPKSMRLLTHRLGLRAYREHSPEPTYPANRPRRCLDWILVSRHLQFVAHQTVAARVSDHLAVFADLRLRD